MLIRKIKFASLLLLLIGGMTMTSCSDTDLGAKTEIENLTDSSVETILRGGGDETGPGERGKRGKKGKKRGKPCFNLVYPVSIQFADESTAEVENQSAMRAAIKEWFEENGVERSRDNKPSLVFPLQVTLDGETLDVATQEELKEIAQSCRGNRGHGKRGQCFELVYPITLIFADESTATAASQRELRASIKEWFDNAGVEKSEENRPQFQFPIQVTQDDATIDVASQEELQALRETCKEERLAERCFTLVYPLTFDFDGETQTIESKEELLEAIKAYKQENGGGAPRPTMVFPVTVEYQDGTQATAESKDDLKELKEACEDE